MSNLAVNRRAGIGFVTIDGTTYDLMQLSYFANPVKRETLVGQSGVQGYKEMPQACYIEVTLRDAGSMTVADFNAMTSSSVVAVLANGKTVSGDGMWTTDVEAVDTMEASFKVKFEAPIVTESPV